VQRRVPASAINSPQAKAGWTCNLSVVGHYSSSGGFKVWRYTDAHGHLCAFYDTTLLYPMDALSLTGPPSSGVYVLDMTNSAHPVLTGKLTELPMLSPHESLYLNPKRGLLAADLGNPASYPGFGQRHGHVQARVLPGARRDLVLGCGQRILGRSPRQERVAAGCSRCQAAQTPAAPPASPPAPAWLSRRRGHRPLTQ
jgi:hypothetical protein